jgi:hypothetical protein
MRTSTLIGMMKDVVRSKEFVLASAVLAAVIAYASTTYSDIEGHQTAGEFLSLTTLGSTMQTNSYFPDDARNNTVQVKQDVNWHIKVQNEMAQSEYVSLRMKILNSSDIGPNDMLSQPSPASEVFEKKQLIPSNSTWQAPINWSISEVEKTKDHVIIKGVEINNKAIGDLNIPSSDKSDFRMILEVWRYDHKSNDFVFGGQGTNGEITGVWNQIWFNIRT